jgi:hypothetical protein
LESPNLFTKYADAAEQSCRFEQLSTF